MTGINWGIADPLAFQRGYQQSKGIFDEMEATRKQNALNAAGQQYALNPNDPKALNALAAVDWKTAAPLIADQAKTRKEKQEQDAKVVAALARDATDGPSFDAAVDQVVAMGYPEAVQFKGKFSPALRSALMAAGGLKPEGGGDVVVIDGVAFDKATGQPRFESPYPKVVSGPAGIHVQDRIGFGRQGAQPTPQSRTVDAVEPLATAQGMLPVPTITTDEEFDALPAGQDFYDPQGNLRTKPGDVPASGSYGRGSDPYYGGQTPPASGNFP